MTTSWANPTSWTSSPMDTQNYDFSYTNSLPSDAFSSYTTPQASKPFDWVGGIEALGNVAGKVAQGIYAAKGYQPSSYGFSNSPFADKSVEVNDDYLENLIRELLAKSLSKKENDVELKPLSGSQNVVD
jgi:hypothetical protein